MPLKCSNVYFIRMLCLLHAFGHGDVKRKKIKAVADSDAVWKCTCVHVAYHFARQHAVILMSFFFFLLMLHERIWPQLYVIMAMLLLGKLKLEIVHSWLISPKSECLYMPAVLIVQHLQAYFEELCCRLRKSNSQAFCLWSTVLWYWACDGRLLALQAEAKRLVHKFWLWFHCTYTCERNTKWLCLCKLHEWWVKIWQYKLIKFMAL